MKFIQTSTFGVPEFEMKPDWTYCPRICVEQSRRLWVTKQTTGKTITKIVAEALDFYFENVERMKTVESREDCNLKRIASTKSPIASKLENRKRVLIKNERNEKISNYSRNDTGETLGLVRE